MRRNAAGLSSADIRVIAITSAVAAAAGAVASAAVAGIITYWAEKRAEKKARDTATDTAIEAAQLTVQDMLKPEGTSGFGSDMSGYVVVGGVRPRYWRPYRGPMFTWTEPRWYWR